MTRETASAAETAAGPTNGRIPAFRIGVVGHRKLADPVGLIPAIHDAISWLTERHDAISKLAERLLGIAGTRPSLLVISALAEGADRLVAREVLAEPGAELKVVLPLSPGDYLGDFATEDSKEEFIELLQRASTCWQVPASGSRKEAYEKAGHYIVDHCDAVIALWDGKPSRGRGGTATVVEYALEQGVPLVQVPTTGNPAPTYHGRPDEAHLRVVRQATREFQRYNKTKIRGFPGKVSAEREQREPGEPADAPPDSISQARDSAAAWITPYFVRADVLASRVEKRFKVTNATIFLAAAAAVTIVAIQSTFAPHLNIIVIAEVVLLLFLLSAPLIIYRCRMLDRWISYRFLAERFRSAFFLALTGPGDHEQPAGRRAYTFASPELRGLWIWRTLLAPPELWGLWIWRALQEIRGRRPDLCVSACDVASVRDYLSHCWIGKQISYYQNTARRYGVWDAGLLITTVVLFVITLVAAFLHTLGVGEAGESISQWGRLLIVLSICVPAIGAAVHGIKTQAQFRGHCQRYRYMATLLRGLESDMRRAQSLERIHQIAVKTEETMQEENSDWFSLVRLHPTELII